MRKLILPLFLLFSFYTSYSQCATVPVITSFSPSSGVAGTTVTISGNNFDPIATNNTVFFGNTKAIPFSATANSLQVLVPAAATAQFLSVNKSCGSTAMLQYGFRVLNPCAGPVTAGVYTSVSAQPAINRAYSTALGDLDGDGRPEMVAANYINPSNPFLPTFITLYRNLSSPGSIAFADSVSFQVGSTQLYGVFIFDIDMDGREDIIAHSPGSAFSVFRNLSTIPGTILLAARQDFNPGSGSWAMSFGDMDNDGKPDIVYGGNSKAWIVRNTSTPGALSFAAPFSVQMNDPAEFCNTTDVKVADLDGDGRNDIVTANYNCSKVGVCRNLSSAGSLAFDTYFTFPSSGQTYSVAIGDLNNDGKPEIIAGNRDIGTIHIFQNQSTAGSLTAASFMSPVNINTAATSLMVQDLSGDGKPDLVCANGTGNVEIFNNSNATGAMISAASFGTVGYAPLCWGGVARMFDIGDVDGDGFLDIVAPRDANTPSARAEVSRRIPNPAFAGLVTATTLNATANCISQTWKYFYDQSNTDRLLVAVKDNGLNLGTITASTYVDADAGIVNGQRYLRRHYIISSSLNPVGLRRVRLYYTAADFANLQAVSPGLNSASQLSVTKYSGPGEDGIYDPQPGGVLTVIPKSQISTGTAFGQPYLEFDVAGFSEFWIHSGVFVLPLDLLSFNGQKCNGQVCLQWKTENESEFSHFEVEKSFDGQRFNFLAKVMAKNLQQNSYSTRDDLNSNSNMYYRLKQVNANGHFKYSQVIRIGRDAKVDVSLSPNPVKDRVKITTAGIINNVQLVNAAGLVVKQWKPAFNNLYDLGSFPNGIYIIKVFTNNAAESIRVVVAH